MDGPSQPSSGRAPSFALSLLALGAFVLLGFPLVYLLWDAVNHLLAGDLASVRPLASLGALAGLAVLLRALAWMVGRTGGA